MLKKIIADIPVELPLQNLTVELPKDFVVWLYEKCRVKKILPVGEK